MTKKASGYWWDVDPAYIDALRREKSKREEQQPQLELPEPPPPVEKNEEPKPGSTVVVIDI